jgi:hypothetical protein
VTAPPAPSSGVRLLPMLEAGHGERRDCAEYEGCLDRYMQATRRRRHDVAAQCPPRCPSFKSPDRSLELLHRASTRHGGPTLPPSYEENE